MSKYLAVEDWFEVPFDDVVLGFLRGEAHKFEKLTGDACRLIRAYEPQNYGQFATLLVAYEP